MVFKSRFTYKYTDSTNSIMPFSRTWSEEIAAEWLETKGYLVLTAVPVNTPGKGGRNEADVVGAKIIGDTLEIRHIEVGSLITGTRDEKRQRMKRKFSPEVRATLVKIVQEKVGLPGKVKYSKQYVATYASQNDLDIVEECGVEGKKFRDFFIEDIFGRGRKTRPTNQKRGEAESHSPIRGVSSILSTISSSRGSSTSSEK